MGKLDDMTGRIFGRLTVTDRAPTPQGETRAYWLCRCECGAIAAVAGKSLRNGNTQSCGCLAAEWSKAMGANPAFIAKRADSRTVHGHKRAGNASPEYKTWLGMKRRCYDPRSKDYPNWGGRGIVVCERWRNNFEAFLEDMGQKPSAEHQIDRFNPNGPYSPDNCRWVPPSTQGAENRRTIIPIVIDGMPFPSISAACRHFGVNKTAVSYRVKAGIPIETAIKETGRLPARRSRESYLPKDHPDRL